MDSNRLGKTRRERDKKGLTIVYCKYCLEPFNLKDLAYREGNNDVCRSPKCLEYYYKERASDLRRSQLKQKKRQLEENFTDPSWMTGEGF